MELLEAPAQDRQERVRRQSWAPLGLLTELEATLGEWYALAAPTPEARPIACVRASDVPGLSFEAEGSLFPRVSVNTL
jgi:hypothetical protein